MDTLRDPLVARGAFSALPVPDSGDAGPKRSKRAKPIAIAGLAAAMLVGLPSVLVGGASGAGALTPNLPVAPNNIMIFPNRDFITIEGYQDHVGQSGLIEVTRPGVGVVGSAIAVVSGDDVAFEINHPGGYCWGTGTGLNVTPDIQAGDVVSLTFGDTLEAATTTLDVSATDAIQNGFTVTVAGHIGSTVDSANMEQRIIEPALVDTIVGKRDVRAVPGPLTPAPKGGYSSSLEFDTASQTFLATYIFDVEEDAHIAANAGLGERAMAWEVTDDAGNRQGMTIAEFGEPGGPGMGGCPNGPLQSGPPAPTNIVAAKVAAGIKLNWTPAVTIPGTPAILGYEITAVAHTTTGNEQVEIGKRITNPAANTTTITGLDSAESYDVEVVSYSTVGKTFPAAHASVVADSTKPIISASPVGGSYPVAQQVTLTSNELGSDIYYTTDGTDPIANGDTTATATHYTGPIDISAATTLKFAGFDPSNNVSDTVTEQYSITNNPVPAATTFTSSSVGLNAVTLNWAASDPGAPGLAITGYEIKVFSDAAASNLFTTQNTSGTGTTATVNGLTGDTPFWFTVSAKNDVNSVFGPASAVLGPLTPQGALVANAGFDQTGVVRNTAVTLSGAGSTVSGATYAWTQVLTGTQTNLDRVTLAPVPGQPQNVSFTLPFFKFPMVNSPLTFQLAVTVGGVTRTDQVVITPRSDVVSITTAKWKPSDFRVVGVSSPNSIVTVRLALTGTVYGTAVADATGAFDFRLRAGVPTTKPASVVADSNMGGTSAPINVAG
jgi:Fn3 associated/Fibronectin type III domain